MFENNIADENVSTGQLRNLVVKNNLFNPVQVNKGKIIGEFRRSSKSESPPPQKSNSDSSAMGSREAYQ